MPPPPPWVGGVRPFLMRSSSQFRSAGPLALNSPAYAAEVNEVKALGGDGVVTPSARTATQTYIARWWQSNPVASWNDVARQLIARNHLDAADSARVLAMQNLATADAAINTWNDKYHFSFWQAVDEIVEARIWAGVHFRTGDVQAVKLGTNVANFAMENYLQ